MILQYILLFVFGLVVGSFLGALSFRLPRGISIAKGRSFCPNCKHQLVWKDNIPVLSFLLLLGKCRYCKKRISARYPLIEIFTAIGFLLVGSYFYSSGLLGVLYALFVFSLLVLVFVIDFETQIIPDEVIFTGLIISILYVIFLHEGNLFSNLLVGFVLSTFLLLVNLLTGGKGMGLGDVKFAIFGGFYWGYPLGIIWMFLSFLVGGIFGVILLVMGKAKLKQKIAFGPFLVIGFLLTYILGSRLAEILNF